MLETSRPAANSELAGLLPVPEAEASAKPSLWIKPPESQDLDPSLLPARLCGCRDVCLAVIDDF
ncbi:MAG TPA: hypothetical protein PK413_13250 [Thermoanaerobaculia bacterium]|nr:hypothetical protein [Thermoanaerobaculia bacterium]